MRLQTRITIMIVAIVLLSASVTMALTTAAIIHSTDRALERNLFNIAEMVAKLPAVLEELKGPPVNGEAQKQVQDILDASLDVDLIVVCNMRRERYAHPNPDRIGHTLVGDDENDVIEHAKRYISTATGTLGTSIRAFVPVFDGDRQLGFVVAGTLVHRVEKAHRQTMLSLLTYLFSGLGIGLAGAVVLARRVKGILLGLEPEEIARLYSEHSGLLEALHEGVIAIDAEGRISMANESARALLDMRNRDLTGMDVDELLHNCRLPEVMSSGQAEYDKEQEMLGRRVIINRVPIYDKGRVVGAVATFRDKTLLVRLAEELTGAKQLVAALRASSHEFLNKLQVLLGLLDLEKYDQAKKYILDSHRRQLDANKELMSTFRDPIIAGLMLGKASFCREQNVKLVVASDSHVDVIDAAGVTHALVTTVGNLIDNAVEAARKAPGGGKITVCLKNDASRVTVEVRDNGAGIDAAVRERLFMRGTSTKGEGRGLGLFLVRQDLAAVNGEIRVESCEGETVFRAAIPLPGTAPEAGETERTQ